MPTKIFLEFSEKSRARKLIFGLRVNVDKANSGRYDVTRWMVGKGPAKSRNPNISVLVFVFCEANFKFKCLQLN